jgi:hypothetical protein
MTHFGESGLKFNLYDEKSKFGGRLLFSEFGTYVIATYVLNTLLL